MGRKAYTRKRWRVDKVYISYVLTLTNQLCRFYNGFFIKLKLFQIVKTDIIKFFLLLFF
jgi:hypothetical protein